MYVVFVAIYTISYIYIGRTYLIWCIFVVKKLEAFMICLYRMFWGVLVMINGQNSEVNIFMVIK
jgi:hypothetical protein